MAQYPDFTVNDLSTYSGRPVGSYPNFTTEFIRQAVILFKYATCLKDWPDDQDDADLARYAVLSMADSLILIQPYAGIVTNPFNSETIGSYSYSKGRSTATGQKIAQGLPTGDTWFDMAVERLGVCDVIAKVERGSIQVFERDMPVEPDYSKDSNDDDDRFIRGPARTNPVDVPPFYISSDSTYIPDQPR